MHNFAAMAQEFVANKAALQVQNGDELTGAVERLLADKTARDSLASAAKTLADEKHHVIERVMNELRPWLSTMRSAA
jgi:3-deoxy-D-manno-octulosonic-acid transferase